MNASSISRMQDVSIIHGKGYDLASFSEFHPGGPIILYGLGRDATALFESYHSMAHESLVAIALKEYEVPLPVGDLPTKPDFSWNDSVLFSILKKRVSAFFHGRSHKASIPKRLRYLMLYCSFAKLLGPFWSGEYWTLPCLGLLSFLLGCLLLHDSTHGTLFVDHRANEASAVLSTVFGSMHPVCWMHSHVMGHHLYPNVEGYDIDCNYAEWGGLRIKPWVFRYIVMNGLAIIWPAFVEAAQFRTNGFWPVNGSDKKVFQSVQIQNIHKRQFLCGDVGRLCFFFLFIFLPIYHLGFFWGIVFGVTPIIFQGFMLYSCTMTSHAGDDILGESIPPDVTTDWAEHQVACTHDFETSSILSSWLWSGANSQVLHHLFPAVDADHFPALAPVLREVLKELNIEHVNISSWSEVNMKYYRWAWRFNPFEHSKSFHGCAG